ncbi:hypothetical protein GCM10007160_12700 [Litchfieldella qijiaojingensis]|uniref:Flagellar biosynthesis protein n=1 Tax=Litchfieldella qijiaojingensis TaxID=980347 RepID=A0ABQ2YLB5_9GAMM|nr:flagellar biosynthesis protein [Halomonas qijiaojingensis]GGX86810.1 hypothetical protein GCM10007160_12700 [Halomonas qijiaojingensis]
MPWEGFPGLKRDMKKSKKGSEEMMRTLLFAIMIAMVALLSGCATSRSEIAISTPHEEWSQPDNMIGEVVIRTVTDQRVFEEAPPEPSTPSLGFEGAAQAAADIKARAVGRKRNTYGKALGDILLENGQTVEGLVRENLVAAFEKSGFKVSSETESHDPSALVVDVYINELWAWFNPGFWAITLNTRIATDLELQGASSPKTISVHAEDRRQVATESAWVEIIEMALQEYRDEVIALAPSLR